ncbi:MAG: class I SAM-dependent methyltransferase [Myxococcales bacterium]|nr:class I SAM-dependent methyltransferase [Myxococcales bacterium]
MRDELYGTTAKLEARLRLHTAYSTHKDGWFRWLFEATQPGRFDRVLDVGCGEGSYWESNEHLDLPGRIFLTDRSPAMLARAGGRVRRGQCIRASVCALPYGAGSFDAAFANHMLYHAEDVQLAIAELARVVAPGGFVFAATNGPDALKEVFAMPNIAAESLFPFADRFDLHNGTGMFTEGYSDVSVQRYPNHLEVTDAQPVVDYLLSTEAGAQLDTVAQADIASKVQRDIDAYGHFHVTVDTGLIIARRDANH